MGSFYVGCAISNLPIGDNDKIGFMIIGKPRDYGELYPSKSQRPFYTYSTDLYKPFLPPIFGEYGDYGQIDEIRPSATTALIETMFHKPVKTVMDAICCGRGAYDNNGEIFDNYFAGDKSAFDGYDIAVKELLPKVGFVPGEIKENGTQDFVFGDYTVTSHTKADHYNDYYTITDHVRGNILKNKFHARNGTDLLEYFGQSTKAYPGYDPEHYRAVSLLDSLSGTYFLEDVYHEMVSFMEADKYMNQRKNRFTKDWTKFMDKVEQSEDIYFESSNYNFPAVEFIQRETAFPFREQQRLEAYKGTDGFVPMYSLVAVMSSLNRMLIPSFCGEQCGNDSFSSALNVSTQKILDKRMKEYEDYYDGDDLDDEFDEDEG